MKASPSIREKRWPYIVRSIANAFLEILFLFRLCRYAIKNIQVMATSARMVVQDCIEAEDNVDARDKFFMFVSVASFDAARCLMFARRQGGCPGI